MRLTSIVSSSAVLAALCTMLLGGCGGTLEDESSDPALRGEELNSGVTAEDAQGKITICHVPPGNPANAHTLVVGAPAWNGHSKHAGDHLGACEGTPPPPPPPPPDGGTDNPPPPPPPPPPPACAAEGAACGGTVVCCDGLQCNAGTCQTIIN